MNDVNDTTGYRIVERNLGDALEELIKQFRTHHPDIEDYRHSFSDGSGVTIVLSVEPSDRLACSPT